MTARNKKTKNALSGKVGKKLKVKKLAKNEINNLIKFLDNIVEQGNFEIHKDIKKPKRAKRILGEPTMQTEELSEKIVRKMVKKEQRKRGGEKIKNKSRVVFRSTVLITKNYIFLTYTDLREIFVKLFFYLRRFARYIFIHFILSPGKFLFLTIGVILGIIFRFFSQFNYLIIKILRFFSPHFLMKKKAERKEEELVLRQWSNVFTTVIIIFLLVYFLLFFGSGVSTDLIAFVKKLIHTSREVVIWVRTY